MSIEIAPKLYVRLLGSLCVTVGEEALPPLRSRNGLHLLALLALHANQEVSREWIAGTLWPESREEQALANLRRTLTDLRRALGPASDHLVSPTTHTLRLCLTMDECDLLDFDAALASNHPDGWRKAIALYRAPLLADCYTLWVEPDRAARQEGYLRARERLSQHESAPEAALSGAAFPHNLPQPTTVFIGREREREELATALRTERLITLTGAGGIGKTRLALEAAGENGPAFPEGVWFVELAAITDPALVPSALATAIGLREETGRPIPQTLLEALRSRTLLLVLDNCEHLVDACAACVDALLRECPQVRVLATSRQALGVTGEVVWPLSPLPLPAPEALSGGEPALELLECASARLFVDRAQATLPTFRLTPLEAPAVAQICRRLDGIPLALELAAARLRSLSVLQIAARLDDSFRLLTQGDRSALPRQQTLRALIEWSYAPLSGPERRLFHRLSVFTGGWTLEACEAVCAGEGLEREEILDLLTHLVEKSLVVAETEREHRRYRLLEVLRQYAAEKLTAEGAASWAAEQHRRWCIALAEKTETALRAGDQSEAIQRLDADLENIRCALQQPGDAAARLQIAAALGGYWYIRGFLREGRKWLSAGLAECPEASAPLRCKALKALGDLCWAMADYPEAWRLHEENLQLQQKNGDIRGVAYTLISMGLTLYHQGQIARACDYYEQSRDHIRQIGDQRALGVILTNLAIAQKDLGEYAAARQALQEAETLLRELGNLRGLASNLHSQALIAKRCSDYAAAKAYLQEAQILHEELKDTHGTASSHHTLGEVAYFEGDYSAAQRYYEAALAVFEELGAKRYVAGTLCNLGELMCALGDLESARGFHRRSLYLEREAGNEAGALTSLQSIASLEQADGHPANAVLLHAAVMTRFTLRNTPLAPNIQEEFTAQLEQLQATLGEGEYARLWAEGAAFSLEEAIAFAAVL